ncbi:hypothetical protein [Pseudomonas putida]|uniref:hypothetical protein n=1 Tax=Pseudomonas putida TaxID=303 RepID=UPI0039DFE5BA
MPGFADLLNQGINNLTGTPLGQFGTQMLLASGPQQGNPGIGARLGQAMAGMSDMQRAQALQQYREQMIQMQQQHQLMQQQAAQRKADEQAQYQARLQDPAFLQSLSPTARQFATLGATPADIMRGLSLDNLQQHRQATLQQQQSHFDQRQANHGGSQPSGPRTPAPRPYIDQPIGNNQMQRYKFDPSINDYAPWGEPFNQFSPGRKSKTGADGMTDAILIPEQPDAEAVPYSSALPGTGNLQSYMPHQQGPVGVLPMSAAGGGAAQKPAPKAGTRVPGQAQVARPLTKEDYAALPSGTQYIDPVSGRTATKR